MDPATVSFVKMHGAGNDYVYVDGFAGAVEAGPELARQVSDRRCGVGSDGLIIIAPSERAHARMVMYNADGSRSAMCGNGLRCLAKFLFDRGRAPAAMRVETEAGLFPVEVIECDSSGKALGLRVEMGCPTFERAAIPVARPSAAEAGPLLDAPLEVAGRSLRVTAVGLGNPHCVVFVDDVDSCELERLGPALEIHPLFPDRTNVEFVAVLSPRQLKQRTWERGSGETFACGSGAVAAAVAARRLGRAEAEVTVQLRGGTLGVTWEGGTAPAFLAGPAVEVFAGEICVSPGT